MRILFSMRGRAARRRRLYGLAAVLCGALAFWALRAGRSGLREAGMPPESGSAPSREYRARISGAPAARDLRLLDRQGRWDIRVGGLEVRGKRAGLFRVGAFNEAIVDDFRIALRRDLDAAVLGGMLRALVSELLASRPLPARADDRSYPVFFGHIIGSALPDVPARISFWRIRTLALFLIEPGLPDSPVLRADRASAFMESGNPGLRLEGGVEMADSGGGTIMCRSADIIFGEQPIVRIRHGSMRQADGGTRTIDTAAFPLTALWREGGLADLAAPPAAPARRAAY